MRAKEKATALILMIDTTERVMKEALLKQRARTMAPIYLTEMYCKWRPLRYLSVF